MRLVRTWLTVLLAVAWLPLVAHCQVEGVTGLEGLRCQAITADTSSGNSHCDDSCCGFESAQYRLPSNQTVATAPLLAVVLPVLACLADDAPAERTSLLLATSPPQPPKPWQFSSRAALPARAPSFAS